MPLPLYPIRLVQNLHQSAAAEGDGLARLDVQGLVAGDAVHIGVIGSADHGHFLGFLLGQTVDMERGSLVLAGDIHADGG